MYSLEQLIGGFRKPKRVLRKLNMEYHRRSGAQDYNTKGIDVMAEDWDNLLILDACRYDMFESLHGLSGKLQRVTSRGSCTPEFLQGNFADRQLHDTVYVTANPMMYEKNIPSDFHATLEVWRENGWDDKTNTVLPKTMNTYAKDAATTYTDKRLIFHYIQPHYPFIKAPTDWDKNHLHKVDKRDHTVGFWEHKFRGELNVSKEEIWQHYNDNLQAVLPHVEELIDELEGKTVVTSDHGNMVGERSRPIPYTSWGHPMHIYTKPLVEVPWLVHDSDERREIVSEKPGDTDSRDLNEAAVKEKLEHLGYM